MNTGRAILVLPKQNQATRSLRRMTEALPSMGRKDNVPDRFFATNEKSRFAPLRLPATIPTSAPMGVRECEGSPAIRRMPSPMWDAILDHGSRATSHTAPSRAEQNLLHNFQLGEKKSKPVVPKIEDCRVQVGWRPPYIKTEILSQKRSCSFLSFIAFYLLKRNFLRTRTTASVLYSSHDARDFRRMGDNRHLDLRRRTHWCTSLCFPRSNEGAECRT
jgi:hypothetical protein